MSNIRYSSNELAAFAAADKLSDGEPITNADVLKILLAITHDCYQARKHLDRAYHGLTEKSKAKRENIAEIIRMERE